MVFVPQLPPGEEPPNLWAMLAFLCFLAFLLCVGSEVCVSLQ